MIQHTPGPWIVNDGDGFGFGEVEVAANVPNLVLGPGGGTHTRIATVIGENRKTALANAHLIATVLDLLAALQCYRDLFPLDCEDCHYQSEECPRDSCNVWVAKNKADAAIAKATGESHA